MKGKRMIAGTGHYNNFWSEDSGVSWIEMSDTPHCSSLVSPYYF